MAILTALPMDLTLDLGEDTQSMIAIIALVVAIIAVIMVVAGGAAAKNLGNRVERVERRLGLPDYDHPDRPA